MEEEEKKEKEWVWYCSYGSNISFERFRVYVYGGSTAITIKAHQGCSNPPTPREMKPTFGTIPCELYFAYQSVNWENGGIAFIEPHSNKITHTQMYKLPFKNFMEIVKQENKTLSKGVVSDASLTKLIADGSISIGKPDENKTYGRLLFFGLHDDGIPKAGFTAKEGANFKIKPPSQKYLETIIDGLIENKHLSVSEIVDYFKVMQGINGKYSEEHLLELTNRIKTEKPIKCTVAATGKVQRQGEFVVQLREDVFEKNNKPQPTPKPRYCVIQRNDKFTEVQAKIEYVENDSKILKESVVNIDQKLRYALSLPKGTSVFVHFLTRKNKKYIRTLPKFPLGHFDRLFKVFFGVQYNLVRSNKATGNDLETNICRILKESMEVIGVKPNSIIIAESPYGRVALRALELSPNAMKEQENKKKNKSYNMFSCSKVLELNEIEPNKNRPSGTEISDIKPIMLDFDARNKLKVTQCTPIRIRRSLIYEIGQQLYLISTPLIIALAVILSRAESLNFYIKGFFLILGFLLILLFILLKTRLIVDMDMIYIKTYNSFVSFFNSLKNKLKTIIF